MGAKISPLSGRRYGIERVCRIAGYPRSSFYAKKRESKVVPKKRGSKPWITDEQLLEFIRSDLARSAFSEEGHRKVWGRPLYGEG